MKNKINLQFNEACKRFREKSLPYTSENDIINLEGLIDMLTEEFSSINIVGAKGEDLDADMLFFEYGTSESDTKGVKFSLSLKRQVFMDDPTGGGQYGFTAYFNPETVNLKNYFMEEFEGEENGNNCVQKIKSSEGYLKIKSLNPEKFEIVLQ